MSVSGHIDQLKRKHQEIAERVESVERSPSPDAAIVQTLKKQKLKIKEQIARLS